MKLADDITKLSSDKLNKLEEKFNKKMKDIGFDQGWSFLYTGPETYNPEQKFMFVGLNPGGEHISPAHKNYSYGCYIANSPNSNAYLDEDWGIGKGEASLQKQMQSFFKALCAELQIDDWEEYMKNSLSMNFIPFRSSSWASLQKKKEVLEFTDEIWKEIIHYIEPRAILTMDNITRDKIFHMLIKSSWKHLDLESECEKINWGSNKYYLDVFMKDSKKLLIAKFPHLSSRKIFSREACAMPRLRVIKKIAEALQ